MCNGTIYRKNRSRKQGQQPHHHHQDHHDDSNSNSSTSSGGNADDLSPFPPPSSNHAVATAASALRETTNRSTSQFVPVRNTSLNKKHLLWPLNKRLLSSSGRGFSRSTTKTTPTMRSDMAKKVNSSSKKKNSIVGAIVNIVAAATPTAPTTTIIAPTGASVPPTATTTSKSFLRFFFVILLVFYSISKMTTLVKSMSFLSSSSNHDHSATTTSRFDSSSYYHFNKKKNDDNNKEHLHHGGHDGAAAVFSLLEQASKTLAAGVGSSADVPTRRSTGMMGTPHYQQLQQQQQQEQGHFSHFSSSSWSSSHPLHGEDDDGKMSSFVINCHSRVQSGDIDMNRQKWVETATKFTGRTTTSSTTTSSFVSTGTSSTKQSRQQANEDQKLLQEQHPSFYYATPPFEMSVHSSSQDIEVSKAIANDGCYECRLWDTTMSFLKYHHHDQQQQRTSSSSSSAVSAAATQEQNDGQQWQQQQETVFIDMGSHIGFYSLSAAALGYRVIALEPYKPNQDQFCASILKNSSTKQKPITTTSSSKIGGTNAGPTTPGNSAALLPNTSMDEQITLIGAGLSDVTTFLRLKKHHDNDFGQVQSLSLHLPPNSNILGGDQHDHHHDGAEEEDKKNAVTKKEQSPPLTELLTYNEQQNGSMYLDYTPVVRLDDLVEADHYYNHRMVPPNNNKNINDPTDDDEYKVNSLSYNFPKSNKKAGDKKQSYPFLTRKQEAKEEETTLSSSSHRPSVVLKIDIVGSECKALAGGLEYLSSVNIEYVSVEWSFLRLFLNGACPERQAIFDLFLKNGLSPYMELTPPPPSELEKLKRKVQQQQQQKQQQDPSLQNNNNNNNNNNSKRTSVSAISILEREFRTEEDYWQLLDVTNKDDWKKPGITPATATTTSRGPSKTATYNVVWAKANPGTYRAAAITTTPAPQ